MPRRNINASARPEPQGLKMEEPKPKPPRRRSWMNHEPKPWWHDDEDFAPEYPDGAQ